MSQLSKFSDALPQNPSSLLLWSRFWRLGIHHSQTSHWASCLNSPLSLYRWSFLFFSTPACIHMLSCCNHCFLTVFLSFSHSTLLGYQMLQGATMQQLQQVQVQSQGTPITVNTHAYVHLCICKSHTHTYTLVRQCLCPQGFFDYTTA